jgi:ABC-type oligopeptide transport system substrate-binding subunit/DNA-binding SARP family transcriptional activator
MLQVRLLGQYEIHLGDQAVFMPSRSAQSLLAYLLLTPNTSHRRERLAGLFWPDASESNARSNLRHALWRVRKALGSGATERIICDDLAIKYAPLTDDQIDVLSFRACPEVNASRDELLNALLVYDGDLLPGFYENWVVLERERLQAEFERKLARLLDLLLAESNWNEALEWGERWIAFGGIPEPAYRALMLAHAGLGNLSAAISQYQRCVEALEKELGIGPSVQTHQIYDQIRNGILQPQIQPPVGEGSTLAKLISSAEMLEKPTPIFVGREEQLSMLDKYLERALTGQVMVAFVNGEAGSGKSALLEAFTRHSLTAHPDLVVGWGVCNAFFGQGAPFLPFRDVINMLAGGIDALIVNGMITCTQANGLRGTFPQVLSALMDYGPGLINTFVSSSILADRAKEILPGDQSMNLNFEKFTAHDPRHMGEQDNTQLFEQYTQVLRNIAIHHPLLILLDDLQWMDPGSGRLLFHLIRRLKDMRILIVGAYRTEEVITDRFGERHPLEPLLNEVKSSFGDITIDLDFARETAGKCFIDAFLDTEPNRLSETFRQELYRRTRGNPLFTIQMLRNLQERGEIVYDDSEHWIASPHLNWNTLPPQVEGIIGERIARLDQDLQDLLMVASVEGEQFTVQVLQRVAGLTERVLLHKLSRELEKRHRLVQEMGESVVGAKRIVHFRFVHGLIQQYIYRQLGVAERTLLHREVAETIESINNSDIDAVAARLARHYMEAGVKEKTVEYLLIAGDQARSLYAHQEAIDHYQHALVYLKELGAAEQAARTLMKLYLVYHSAFDFKHAQEVLEECNLLWQKLKGSSPNKDLPAAQGVYRVPAFTIPNFDPALADDLFNAEWINQLFFGLVEWSEERNVTPFAAKHWDVVKEGRRYILHLRRDLYWSDGTSLSAHDFEYAWKRILDPATQSLSANLFYDIVGAKDFNQGRVDNPSELGVLASDPYTLIVDLEEPCGYFPYILGHTVAYAVPKHIIESEGNDWTRPGQIVTSGAYQIDVRELDHKNEIYFSRNPRYFGDYAGNIEQVKLVLQKNELDMYRSFVAGDLDMVEFLVPQLHEEEWKHYREVDQLHISPLPFVDSIHFITNRPPFDNPDVRRAFAMATDREKLARLIENHIPATGGYIPPGLPGHSPEIGLPYNPREARNLLASAGYSQPYDFPDVFLLIGLVGLEKGDSLVFQILHEMWKENLGISIQERWHDPSMMKFDPRQDFNFFFIGWLADFPDPASFLQMNFLLDQCHWKYMQFEALIEQGRLTLDQAQRMEIYRQADRMLMQEAVALPLFYGHMYELRQPWVHKPARSSIYTPQWKDIILMPH